MFLFGVPGSDIPPSPLPVRFSCSGDFDVPRCKFDVKMNCNYQS